MLPNEAESLTPDIVVHAREPHLLHDRVGCLLIREREAGLEGPESIVKSRSMVDMLHNGRNVLVEKLEGSPVEADHWVA